MQSTNENYENASNLPSLADEINDKMEGLTEVREANSKVANDQTQQTNDNARNQIDGGKVCTDENKTGTRTFSRTPTLCGPAGCPDSLWPTDPDLELCGPNGCGSNLLNLLRKLSSKTPAPP
jgi:hypothetical protein